MYLRQVALQRFQATSGVVPAPAGLITFCNFSSGGTPWDADKVTLESATTISDVDQSIGAGVSGTDALISTKATAGIGIGLEYSGTNVLAAMARDWDSGSWCIEGWYEFPSDIGGYTPDVQVYANGYNHFIITFSGTKMFFSTTCGSGHSKWTGWVSHSITSGVPFHWYVQYNAAAGRLTVGVNASVIYNATGWSTYMPDMTMTISAPTKLRMEAVKTTSSTTKSSQFAIWTSEQYATNPTVGNSYTPSSVPIWATS